MRKTLCADLRAMPKWLKRRKSGVVTYLNHNYRRVPVVAYAKQLVDDGRLGTIFHWQGAYFQD